VNVRQALVYASQWVDKLDAELLLGHCLRVARPHVYAWPEQLLTPLQQQQFIDLFEQRQAGKPVAYLTGCKEFWSLSLQVDEHTLIPRPDTESIVELALRKLPRTVQTIVDLGTGSGAIALALAFECRLWSIFATDLHLATLQRAKANAQRLGLNQVQFVAGDWLTALNYLQADAIIANPPYIAADDVHLAALCYEPQAALVAADQGLADLFTLIEQAKMQLKQGGFLLLEHGFDQSASVQAKMRQAGYQSIETCYDLTGHARGSFARYMR